MLIIIIFFLEESCIEFAIHICKGMSDDFFGNYFQGVQRAAYGMELNNWKFIFRKKETPPQRCEASLFNVAALRESLMRLRSRSQKRRKKYCPRSIMYSACSPYKFKKSKPRLISKE